MTKKGFSNKLRKLLSIIFAVTKLNRMIRIHVYQNYKELKPGSHPRLIKYLASPQSANK